MTNRDRPFPSPAAERAVNRYAAKLERGLADTRSDRDLATQTEHYRAAAEHADLRTLQLRQVLWDMGVHSTLHCAYRAFTLHVDRQVRNYEHETLRILVNHAIERWTCRGCDPVVLRAICVRVFALDASGLRSSRGRV
ncbi:MAG: hypothetical protein ABIK86_02075 [candidate division WOR-3 bacterium]